MKFILAFLKAIFGAFFKSKIEPREDSSGNPISEIPEKPDIPANGARPNYQGADKKRYPKASSFQGDPTAASSKIDPRFCILHHTVSYDLDKTVDFFKKRDVSVHYVVGHDGRVVQMLENNVKGWHAGESKWGNISGLNSYSVGIEVVNIGPLKKKGDKFFDYYDKEYKGPVHVRKGLGYEYWEAIRPAQEAAVLDLCYYLHDAIGITVNNFLGHYEIAPKRKNDPYGLFSMGDMDAFRKHLKASL